MVQFRIQILVATESQRSQSKEPTAFPSAISATLWQMIATGTITQIPNPQIAQMNTDETNLRSSAQSADKDKRGRPCGRP
jgi:hypothetical protein